MTIYCWSFFKRNWCPLFGNCGFCLLIAESALKKLKTFILREIARFDGPMYYPKSSNPRIFESEFLKNCNRRNQMAFVLFPISDFFNNSAAVFFFEKIPSGKPKALKIKCSKKKQRAQILSIFFVILTV